MDERGPENGPTTESPRCDQPISVSLTPWRFAAGGLRSAFALAFVASVCSSQLVAPNEPSLEAVDSIFEQKAADEPGCAVGVFRGDSLAYSRAFGMANLELEVPIAADTAFDVASMSKQFTATAILILERRGRLTLDDDVRLHLPELSEFTTVLTLRHLLHHTSGVRDHLVLGALIGKRPGTGLTGKVAMDLLARQKTLNFPPGTGFEYSNAGYFLLGEIVSRASGKSLRDFLASEIFGPLGMARTQVGDVPTRVVLGRASGYVLREGELSVVRPFEVTIGSGGVQSTVSDLRAWHRALYSPSLGFQSPLIELLSSPGSLISGEPVGYGLGLRVANYRGLDNVSHGGGNMGFRSHLLSFPEYQTTFVTLCNISEEPALLNVKLADHFLEDNLTPRGNPLQAENEGTTDPHASPGPVIDPHDYLGAYYSPELDVTYELRLDGDVLLLQTVAPEPLSAEVTDKDRVKAEWLSLEFTRADHNAVDGFRLRAVRAWGIQFERLP